jgi:Family of unknown function (DUF5320)
MGPVGHGPMTGRWLGSCKSANDPQIQDSRGPGFGASRGGGRGAAWRHGQRQHAADLVDWQRQLVNWPRPDAGVAAALSREQELGALSQQVDGLEQILRELRSRIEELEKPTMAAAGKEPR